jgi:hypothetical protein
MREGEVQPGPPAADPEIEAVGASRSHRHPHLTGARLGFGQIAKRDDLGPSVRLDEDGFHARSCIAASAPAP